MLIPSKAQTRSASANGRILHAALVAMLAGVAVKAIAIGKEVAVAGVFGRSEELEAYLAAALIPGLLINLFAETMNQALIPTLVRVREQDGAEAAQRLFSSALLCLCLLLCAVSLGMAFAAPDFLPLISWNYSPGKLHLAIRLFYGLLPLVILGGISSMCAAVLNTCERFAIPTLAPALVPLMILAGSLLWGRNAGIWAVVWASLLGGLLQTVCMASLMGRQGYAFRPMGLVRTEAAVEVARQYGPLILSSLVASGGLLVDQAMAAMLPAGSVSALAYAGRFTSVAMMILGGALSTALTPYISQMTAQQDWASCRHILRNWLGIAALVSAPIALVLIAGAPALIRLTLQHGAFHDADSQAVAPVLAMYAIQVPFFVVSRVFYRFLLALRRTDLIFYCGAINLALDVVLNLVLMRCMGVAGIALATSLWTVSTLIFLGYWTRRLLSQPEPFKKEKTRKGMEAST